LDVVETHDCFSVAELLAYEALGLCEEGDSGRMIDEGETRIGGRIPVNPSGGLIAKGQPLGATGLGQVSEIVTQLRGEAGPRPVAAADTGEVRVCVTRLRGGAGARKVEGARIGRRSSMGMWSSCMHILEAQGAR